MVEPSCPQRIEEIYATRSNINYLSHTRIDWAFHSFNEHYKVVADLEKKLERNRSDASKGENPNVAPTDEIINTLTYHSKERSSILIEPIKKVNISIEKESRIIYLEQSLSTEEISTFIYFFKERQINFAWSYVDMLGLDPTFILHNLNISLEVKLVKEKLKKMHPHRTSHCWSIGICTHRKIKSYISWFYRYAHSSNRAHNLEVLFLWFLYTPWFKHWYFVH